MPHQKAQSVGVLSVREHAMETQELAREVNRALRRVTDHIDTLYGFRGPIQLHDEVNLGGNAIQNVAEGSQITQAATVAQIQRLEALIAQAQSLLQQLQQRQQGQPVLATATPVSIDAGDAGQVGASPSAARGDHEHPVTTAVVGDLQPIGVPNAGSGQSLPRGDHRHGVELLTTAALPAGGAAQNMRLVMEDSGLGGLNLVAYGNGLRGRVVLTIF